MATTITFMIPFSIENEHECVIENVGTLTRITEGIKAQGQFVMSPTFTLRVDGHMPAVVAGKYGENVTVSLSKLPDMPKNPY